MCTIRSGTWNGSQITSDYINLDNLLLKLLKDDANIVLILIIFHYCQNVDIGEIMMIGQNNNSLGLIGISKADLKMI